MDEACNIKPWYVVNRRQVMYVLSLLIVILVVPKVFHKIGNWRGLLPQSVNIMVLIASTTRETFDCMVESKLLE